MKRLTEELKNIALTQVQHSKAQADGPRMEYLTKCKNSYLYEACKLPGKVSSIEDIPDNFTPYVEPVLREAKKEAKPQLLDSFTSDNRLAVSFRSRGWNRHTDLDDLLTFNLNKIILDDQDGYAVIEKVIDEALGPGSAFAKVYVDEQTSHEQGSVEDWITIEDFMSLVADGWVIDAPANFVDDKKGSYKGLEWKTTTDKDTGMISRLVKGTIPLVNIDKKIKIEFVESKDLWFDTTNAENFDKCRYACHRILTTVGEAEKRGFDPEKIKEASRQDQDEILQELSLTGVSDINQDFDSTDPKERFIFIYEHYTYSSQFSKSKETKLYQVIATGNEVLEINEIPFMPFVHAKKRSITGSFYAQGFYEEAKPYQDALTKKYRIADTVATKTAWPRYRAVKGAYDRQSALNANRPGAIIEAQAIDAIEQFPHIPLDQSFITHYEMLRESEKQSLRRGFGSANLEEIPPIATATLAISLYQDSQRGKELSKSFQHSLIIPIYELVYKTASYENWPLEDKDGKSVENVTYPTIYKLTLDVNSPNDDAAQVVRLQDAIQTAAVLAQISGRYLSDQNKYEMLNFMFTRADLDATKYVTDPQTIPDDQHAAEMQKQYEALQLIGSKQALQGLILDNWIKAAEINKTEQTTIEGILKGSSDRAIALQESLTKQQAVLGKNQIGADKNAIENKRANYDAVLGAHKVRHDNAVNGIM